MKRIIVDNQSVTLEPADLIQAGGEGLVFARGDRALKLYHAPTSQHQDKLRYLIQSGLAAKLPPNVYAPQALAFDEQGQVVGFGMARMVGGERPLKKLSNPNFCRRHGVDLLQAVTLLQDVHATLSALHQHQIIVGDLNDHNIFFTPPAAHGVSRSVWIDVDSYQFGGFPCPVALQTFLDPTLYTVADFKARPHFSEHTDWYAFAVLLVKLLLRVHPYGGVHHTYKSLQARAENRVSILNADVTYPKQARPPAVLSDGLRQYVRRTFENGARDPLPRALLDDYANQLASAQRTPHPAAPLQPVPAITSSKSRVERRLLFETAGYIEHVWINRDRALGSSGRFYAVTREEDTYTLVYGGMGGQIQVRPLFNGRPGYRFGFFGRQGYQHLAVNPPQQTHLLILDVSGHEPLRRTLLETARFGSTAVFATTPTHLYRLANGYILRGSVRDGHFLEAIAAPAHRHQTWLWGSTCGDSIAGIQRLFGDYTFFVRNAAGEYRKYPLKLNPAESVKETAVAFSETAVALLLQTIRQGQSQHKLALAQTPTHPLYPVLCPAFITPPALNDHTLLLATDDGVLKQRDHVQTLLSGTADFVSAADTLHVHPNGLLVQQAHKLYLLKG